MLGENEKEKRSMRQLLDDFLNRLTKSSEKQSVPVQSSMREDLTDKQLEDVKAGIPYTRRELEEMYLSSTPLEMINTPSPMPTPMPVLDDQLSERDLEAGIGGRTVFAEEVIGASPKAFRSSLVDQIRRDYTPHALTERDLALLKGRRIATLQDKTANPYGDNLVPAMREENPMVVVMLESAGREVPIYATGNKIEGGLSFSEPIGEHHLFDVWQVDENPIDLGNITAYPITIDSSLDPRYTITSISRINRAKGQIQKL